MTALPTTCSADNLRRLLDDRLDATDEAATCEHLSNCPACRAMLDNFAAGSGGFDLMAFSLRDDALDAETGAMSETGHWFEKTICERDGGAMEAILAQLAPTDDPSMLGRLGPYEVSGVIGAGAMGIVLKGFDKSLERAVAIKVLAPHLASTGVARQRFAREAKAAAAVLHPNVMAIHSVSNDGSLPYLVMPYVRGESLQKRLDKQGPLPVAEVLRIGTQIAAGLSAAHAQGLVHRDIKPANIMLEDGVERVAITDFGLARAVDDASLTRSGMIAGTPHFMSPEQARGETVNAHSDLFSLGSVMYLMCTGRTPFRAETSYGMLKRVAEDEPTTIRELNPDVPQWLCDIVSRLMAKDAKQRYASAAEVGELLEDCLAHLQQPTAVPLPHGACAHPTTARKAQNSRPIFRRPLTAVFSAAFAAALLFAGIVIALEWNKGKLIIESEVDDVQIRIVHVDQIADELTVTKAGTSMRIAAGHYQVELTGEFDGLVVENDTFTLRRGQEEVVRIRHAESTGNSQPSVTPSDKAVQSDMLASRSPAVLINYRGRCVQAEDGSPVGKAVICFFTYRSEKPHLQQLQRVIADSEGRFSFQVNIRNADAIDLKRSRISITAPGRASRVFFWQETSDEVRLELQPASSLTGRVISADGNPIKRAFVYLGPLQVANVHEALTDDSGRFEIDDVAAADPIAYGESNTLVVSHPDFARHTLVIERIPSHVEVQLSETPSAAR